MSDRRIYVACLSCYNSGLLVGRWIDPSEVAEDDVTVGYVHDNDGLRRPWCEELAVHDHEGFGETRSESVRTFYAANEAIESLRHAGDADALIAWIDFEGFDSEGVDIETFEERYAGSHDSDAEFAEEYVGEVFWEPLKELPDILRYRIDWDGVWTDLRCSGEIYVVATSAGRRHYFRSF